MTQIPAVDRDPLRVIRSEYREMPELRLTPVQARRLFGLDPELCDALLGQLVREGFLRLAPDGKYCRAA
jgi:hypothetical protein